MKETYSEVHISKHLSDAFPILVLPLISSSHLTFVICASHICDSLAKPPT